MIVMLAMIAFAVDVGYLMALRAELKRSADAAALGGAGALVDGVEAAELEAFEYSVRNPVGNRSPGGQEDWEENLPSLLSQNGEDFQFEAGYWDPLSKTFTPGDHLPSAVKVTIFHRNAALFFGKLFRSRGANGELIPVDITAESIARYQPREIALALDLSASMNDDSELKRIKEYGESVRDRVESKLLQIYQELGSPAHGNLEFEPEYLTVVGQPASGPIPQITVTFQSSDVFVTSTKDLSNVVLEFSDGSRQKFDGLSGQSRTFRGSGGNYNKRIDKLWVKSGSNASGEGPGYGERFEDDSATIKQLFGMDSVAYPYPSGSWDDYIGYVKSSDNVYRAGYRKKYGYMTLINYWLEKRPKYSQTPDLWKVSAQPITAVKDAVGVFMAYIQEVDSEDRAALVMYNSASQEAVLEHALTADFDTVQDTVQRRQAGHYDNYTNIGAGIREARLELQNHARMGAFKMIVVMTDGQANRPSSSAQARSYALQEAQLANDQRYPVVTISLGDAADTNLMQEIADLTGGVHFNIPGGGTVNDYEEELQDVFRDIADHRPLVLVK